jgi:hypothetical protein
VRRSFTRWLFAPHRGRPGDGLRTGLCRLLYRLRIVTHTRDFTAFHESLVKAGLAGYASAPLAPPGGEVPDDLGVAARRIIDLVGDGDRAAG